MNPQTVTDHIPLAGQAVGAHEVCSEGCGHGLSSPALWFVVPEDGYPDWVSQADSSHPLLRQ